MIEEGLVTKAIAGFFYVEYEGQTLECKSSTKLKQKKQKILPGDSVNFDYDKRYIIGINERTNELIRPQITNVKNAILVFSVAEPEMNFYLLDKFLMIMDFNQLESIILITKMDLIDRKQQLEYQKKLDYYTSIGYQVLINDDTLDQEQFSKYLLAGQKYVITGQTGVGKSTFLNKILNLNIKTQEISKALGRGKHTTRETIFYPYTKNIYLIDTPGFSSLEIPLTKEQKRDNFREFVLQSEGCKFKTCYHNKEPNCAIKKNLENGNILESRYKNYLKLLEE